jgi:hypothetical protein
VILDIILALNIPEISIKKSTKKSSEKITKKYLPKSLITDVYFNILNKKKKLMR